MMLNSDKPSSCWHSKIAAGLALLGILGLIMPGQVSAKQIDVEAFVEFQTGACTFRDAIEAHNRRAAVGDCSAGDGDDLILILAPQNRIVLGAPVTVTNGKVTIAGGDDPFCDPILGAAYLTIEHGASVTLQGVGFDANGSFQRSVIENDGGELIIKPTTKFFKTDRPRACRFSNEKKGPPVLSGGILVNRNGGTTVIEGADFVNSSARPVGGLPSLGGAINIESGSVTIRSSPLGARTRFRNNTADFGGAISVDEDGTLNIESGNFEFVSNRAGQCGGAIFAMGNVNILGLAEPFKSASFARNQSDNNGGAICTDDSNLSVNLSIDGVEFDSNQADNNGGAVYWDQGGVSASLTNSFFHRNSAGNNGGAIIVATDSAVEVRRSTFAFDGASGRGGGIFVDSVGELNFINSTMLVTGVSVGEGIDLNDSSRAEVVFSTISLTFLHASEGPADGQLTVSNSILNGAFCDEGVIDGGHNLQFESSGCPNSIPTMNPDLDHKGLADNGGPTPTVALLKGSPAIDAIPLADCVDQENNPVTTDQRGFPRPAQVNGPCDIGAFEFQILSSPLPDDSVFKCYRARGNEKFERREVTLADQFETKETRVLKPVEICNPVDKDGEGLLDATAHLTCFKIKDGRGQPRFQKREVLVENQFGQQALKVKRAKTLCVPSEKEGISSSSELDHFKCYRARRARGAEKFERREVTLADQFETKEAQVLKPVQICNPVDKDGEGILDETAHLTCFKIKDGGFQKREVGVEHQFGSHDLKVKQAKTLCVPSLNRELP